MPHLNQLVSDGQGGEILEVTEFSFGTDPRLVLAGMKKADGAGLAGENIYEVPPPVEEVDADRVVDFPFGFVVIDEDYSRN